MPKHLLLWDDEKLKKLNGQPKLVIDRKRMFLFRPKTNIQQENAAEYSADNEYSAHGRKH
jgi:hypothetical protein